MTTTTQVRRRRNIRAYMVSDLCYHCGARALYEDFDPHRFHHGLTCLMCAREQVLSTGVKSLIDPTAPRGKGSKGGHWGWRNN